MINIKIDNELKEKSPNIKLGVIKYKAVVKKSSKESLKITTNNNITTITIKNM